MNSRFFARWLSAGTAFDAATMYANENGDSNTPSSAWKTLVSHTTAGASGVSNTQNDQPAQLTAKVRRGPIRSATQPPNGCITR
jgi:hypothetical protein